MRITKIYPASCFVRAYKNLSLTLKNLVSFGLSRGCGEIRNYLKTLNYVPNNRKNFF